MAEDTVVLNETESVIREKELVETPKMYRVLILNDEATVAYWVVEMLVAVFNKTLEESMYLTRMADRQGSAIVGIYTKDIAASKVELGMTFIRNQAATHGMVCQFNFEVVPTI